jgi:hypothetical protein
VEHWLALFRWYLEEHTVIKIEEKVPCPSCSGVLEYFEEGQPLSRSGYSCTDCEWCATY